MRVAIAKRIDGLIAAEVERLHRANVHLLADELHEARRELFPRDPRDTQRAARARLID